MKKKLKYLTKKKSESRELLATTSNKNKEENLRQSIAEIKDAINKLVRENEEIEQTMALKDRVKAIFQKIWIHRISRDICCWLGHWRYRG